jgi:hypothetical protein
MTIEQLQDLYGLEWIDYLDTQEIQELIDER